MPEPEFLPLDPGTKSQFDELPLVDHLEVVEQSELVAAVLRVGYEDRLRREGARPLRRRTPGDLPVPPDLPASLASWNRERGYLDASGCWHLGKRIRRDAAVAYWIARLTVARVLGLRCERVCRLRLVMARRRA